MVLDYYNLKEEPFGVTPDPRYLYLSKVHREALATLSYGIRSRRGFMSLIAEPGMGKTTILFHLFRQLEGSARTVFLFQTLCSPKDLLRGLLRDLGVVDDDGDQLRLQDRLNQLLLAEARQGRRVVVIIDEAQNLEDSALELMRMLSNFETASCKLMQIILSGQPQLREKLASPHLLQLRQRMSIFARLHPFSAEETQLYVNHRLRVAGYHFKTAMFTPQAAALIAKYSEGIPRNINNICFNSLSLGCALKQQSIREEVVRESLQDLDIEVEAANDPDEEPAGRELVAPGARPPKMASRRPCAWQRRVAVCVLLVLQLLCFTGRQSSKALGSRSLLADRTAPRPATVQLLSAAPIDHLSYTTAAVNSESVISPLLETLADETSSIPAAKGPAAREKSRPIPRAKSEQTTDPDQLWAQVGNEDSDAEVALARLYLEGTAVPKSCAQAKVLLLAASRRGNTSAADLLSDFDVQCR